VGATVAAVASALPEQSATQAELWEERFRHHYGDDRAARRIWSRCGVEHRHGVVDPIGERVYEWGTEQRMQRFVEEGLPLGRAALETALDRANLGADEVDLLTVVSCTGYATPGLDILLARDLGMRADVQRLHVGHMGCYAAIPALAAVANASAARGGASLMLCVELTTLHVQPAARELDQIVAHALFGDAAAAAAVRPGGAGLEVVDVAAHTDTSTAALMSWDVTDTGFRMGLSPKVPDAVRGHVAPVVDALLERNGLRRADVRSWIVHPGGPAIVDAVGEAMALEEDALESSRATLREVGNCSSATVLLVLERALAGEELRTGDHAIALAFGPGLTLYGCLLRFTRASA
jgi:alkylresorcinol/alkylpyrone synthase